MLTNYKISDIDHSSDELRVAREIKSVTGPNGWPTEYRLAEQSMRHWALLRVGLFTRSIIWCWP